jgi:fructose-1,6-bisphosphatase-3
VRESFLVSLSEIEKRDSEDFIWWLWCGKHSPLFGRVRMTTFERMLVGDKATHEEPKNWYYKHTQSAEVAQRILAEFGLDPEEGHIISGHIPVKSKDGESPIKAGGRLLVIDGGFCKAYQPTTGLAGYTLIYNSHGMRLVSHEPFDSIERAVMENTDILSTSKVFETAAQRKYVADTDIGRELRGQIDALQKLLEAYRSGAIAQRGKGAD